MLGGKPGIGKDTILEPVKQAIGPWNFADVSPKQVLGRFNGFLRSVILRVNEARDLGEFDRYAFRDHMKAYIAAPPDVVRVDEKNLREYYVFNLCGVVITSNHKADGIYLPADDRRHMVAWSNLTKDDFADNYWRDLYGWYINGGNEHVAAYLAGIDLSGFDSKAPPPKTQAFWEIANANRAPEDVELADVLDDRTSSRSTKWRVERPHCSRPSPNGCGIARTDAAFRIVSRTANTSPSPTQMTLRDAGRSMAPGTRFTARLASPSATASLPPSG